MKNETIEGIEKGTYLLDGKGNGYHTYLTCAAFRNVLIDSGLDEIFLSRQGIRSLAAVFSFYFAESGSVGDNIDSLLRLSPKHEKQEKVRGLIWSRLLIPTNSIWSSARFVMEKGNYPRILMGLMPAEDVEVLGSLKKNLKSSKNRK